MYNFSKYLILFLILFLASCTPKYLPTYYQNAKDIKPKDTELYEVMLKVDLLEDTRTIQKGDYLASSKKKFKLNGKNYCINTSSEYNEDFLKYLSLFGAKYINLFTPFRRVSTLTNQYDYRLKWSLKKYRAFQEFNEDAKRDNINAALIAGAFGAVGSIVASSLAEERYTSMGEIEIIIDDIILLRKDGSVVAKIGEKSMYLNDIMMADAKCDCVYYNIDLHFKKLLKELMPSIVDTIKKDKGL